MRHCPITANAAIAAIARKLPGHRAKKQASAVAAAGSRPEPTASSLFIRKVLATAVIAVAGITVAAFAPVSATAAPPRLPITLGIHDGAIDGCDKNGTQTTPPTTRELAAAVSSFNSPYWRALNVHTVRFSPPWDIAYHHDTTVKANAELATIQDCFDAWLAGAKNAGATVETAFKPDPNFKSPDGRFVGVPDIATYTAAIEAFVGQYSTPASTGAQARVTIIAPWGEPDFRGSGTHRIFMPAGGHLFADPNCHGSNSVRTCGPILAAQMWAAVHAACGAACTLRGQKPGSGVIAGDFSGLGGLLGPEAGPGGNGKVPGTYLDVYRKHLNGLRPLVWALHPYGDLTNFERAYAARRPAPSSPLTGLFAQALDNVGYHQHTQIWLDEISAFQYHSMNGTNEPSWTPAVQSAAGRYLLTQLPQAADGSQEPTVTRAYYLNFQAADPVNSRWALVLAGGTQPQPIYYTFARR
jgi:hypothetical protein